MRKKKQTSDDYKLFRLLLTNELHYNVVGSGINFFMGINIEGDGEWLNSHENSVVAEWTRQDIHERPCTKRPNIWRLRQ